MLAATRKTEYKIVTPTKQIVIACHQVGGKGFNASDGIWVIQT
jgi:hypothetical protein